MWTTDHIQLAIAVWASVVVPLGSGIGWLIYKQAQRDLKIDMMWEWYTNHGHDITGYQPGDEHRRK